MSYHSADREFAQALCERLLAAGFSVWFDRELFAGGEYRQQIGAELISADLVLALWTPGAVESGWVRAEARSALTRGRLVSINVNSGIAPHEFAATVAATIDARDLQKGAARLERALKEAAGSAFGYERIYSAGELLPHRVLDISLTFIFSWLALTASFYAAFYGGAAEGQTLVRDGHLYLRYGGQLVLTPDIVLLLIGLFFTSFFAPFAFLGSGALDFVGRRLFKLSISPSRGRAALRWLGEAIGATLPLMLTIWIVSEHTRTTLLASGWTGWVSLFVGEPLVCLTAFALMLAPKYAALLLSQPLRRACMP